MRLNIWDWSFRIYRRAGCIFAAYALVVVFTGVYWMYSIGNAYHKSDNRRVCACTCENGCRGDRVYRNVFPFRGVFGD